MKIFQNNPNLKWIFLVAFIALNALFGASGLLSTFVLLIVNIVIVFSLLLIMEVTKNTQIHKKRILIGLVVSIGLVVLVDFYFLSLLNISKGNTLQIEKLFRELFFFSQFVIIALPIFLGLLFSRSGSNVSFGIFAAILVGIAQTYLEVYFDQFVDAGAGEGLWALSVMPILIIWIVIGIGRYLLYIGRSDRFHKIN